MAQLYHSNMKLPNGRNTPILPSSMGSGLGEESADLSTSLIQTAVGEVPMATKIVEPNGNPGPETKKRVVVVGAGISGLRAAAVLQSHGVDVVVVEGRDRIGGRIHTTHSEKGPRDIGM